MSTDVRTIRATGVLAVAAALVVLVAGNAHAQANIPGITGTSFSFTAGPGELSTPDGNAVHIWGYRDTTGVANPFGVPQIPGPTLIVNQGATVQVTLTSNLPFGKCTSIVFPGHAVTVTAGSGDQDGLLTRETCPGGTAVVYTFTATDPGTYTYHSGTQPELQVEMGLVGALIVRPTGYDDVSNRIAYPGVTYDHEYLFLTMQMDPRIHVLAEQNRFSEIDTTTFFSTYWFFNGRLAPDIMADAFVSWLPHQPYNAVPRMTPGQRMLMRVIGADQGQHPFHYHGNNADIIARDGRRLTHSRSQFSTLTVPGETVDQIFTWTGAKLGWDIYGGTDVDMPHTCNGKAVGEPQDPGASEFDPGTHEYCADHGKPFPVVLPEQQNLAFGGWWSGSPYLGACEQLPPGQGGLNPNCGYFFMWHSHTEKELTNFDIFPGGMLSMMVVEPPGTPIP